MAYRLFPSTRARAKNFQIYGVPLLSIVAGLTIVPTLLNMFHEVPRDFVVFMESARWLRAGLDPYRELLAQNTPNANPPGFLLATLPLTLVSDRMAFYLWTLGSTLALVFSLWKTASALKFALRISDRGLGLTGCFSGAALRSSDAVAAPLITLAWTADREGRKVAAGGWLGALIYVKPFVGVYALYMLWRREWRTLRMMIGVWVVLAAIGLLAGIRVTLSWIETLRGITGKTSHVVNASWPALIARMFTPDLSQPGRVYTPFIVSPVLALALTILGILSIAVVGAWAVTRTKTWTGSGRSSLRRCS